jgi:GT2 family glycosyltransferase
LDGCLAALGRQTYPPERFEVIVADNDSRAGRDAVLAAVADRGRVVFVTERGAAAARNAAVATARGRVLAFTDSDCVPDADWLAKGVACVGTDRLAGGAMRVSVQDERRLTAVEAFERVFAFDNEAYVKRKGFSVTANLFSPRHVFDAVGGFRPGVSEDHDWCVRATEAGFAIGFCGGAVVTHPARRTWDELVRKWDRVEREMFGLHAARGGRSGRWVLRAVLFPVSALAHAPRVLTSRRLTDRATRVRALRVLARIRLWRMRRSLQIMRGG